MWYQLNKIGRSVENQIRADVCVPDASPWFDGHFPGEPVLPGVAQIGMVYDVLKTVSAGELTIVSVNRIRFKRIVRPGDRLEIIVSSKQKNPGLNTFQILSGDELVCSGMMQVEKNFK